MSLPYRFPGPRPFERGEQTVFFGREEDTRRIIEQLQLEPLLLLYGKSGLGKSSLLNAGIIPQMEEKRGLQTFKIRFEAWQEDGKENTMPLERAQRMLDANSTILDRILPEERKSLWHLLKARQFQGSNFKGCLLVFDQFEELFTYPEAAIKSFASQLSELLYTTIPDRYRLGLEKIMASSSGEINEEDLKTLHLPFELRVVMAIRSDRYSLLDRIKGYLPTLYASTFELFPLGKDQAEEAILNPAYEEGEFSSPVFDYKDEALDHLISFLSQGKENNIESFQLQILCEYVERELVIKQRIHQIGIDVISSPEEILEQYYLRQIESIEDKDEQLAVRRLIEEGFIFEAEERRLSLYEGQIEKSYGVTKSQLRRLVDSHLIRSEASLKGGYTYELSHDTLVAPVLKAKAIRQKAEQEEADRKAVLEQQAELAKAKRESARARRIAIIMAVLAIAAVLSLLVANSANSKAKENEKVAQEAQREAEDERDKAESELNRRIAVESEAIIREVKILIDANQSSLAQSKLEEGIANDSTNLELKELYNRLIQQKQ